MPCDNCGKDIPFIVDPEISPGANAARANRTDGVVVKTFMLHGDDVAFRFFCSKDCVVAKRRMLFPGSDTRQAEIDGVIDEARRKLRE